MHGHFIAKKIARLNIFMVNKTHCTWRFWHMFAKHKIIISWSYMRCLVQNVSVFNTSLLSLILHPGRLAKNNNCSNFWEQKDILVNVWLKEVFLVTVSSRSLLLTSKQISYITRIFFMLIWISFACWKIYLRLELDKLLSSDETKFRPNGWNVSTW